MNRDKIEAQRKCSRIETARLLRFLADEIEADRAIGELDVSVDVDAKERRHPTRPLDIERRLVSRGAIWHLRMTSTSVPDGMDSATGFASESTWCDGE